MSKKRLALKTIPLPSEPPTTAVPRSDDRRVRTFPLPGVSPLVTKEWLAHRMGISVDSVDQLVKRLDVETVVCNEGTILSLHAFGQALIETLDPRTPYDAHLTIAEAYARLDKIAMQKVLRELGEQLANGQSS